MSTLHLSISEEVTKHLTRVKTPYSNEKPSDGHFRELLSS